METLIIIFVSFATFIIGFIIAKKFDSIKYDVLIQKAKAKATVIENEAQNRLKNAQNQAKIDYEKEYGSIELFVKNTKFSNESKLKIELEKINYDKNKIQNIKNEVTSLKKGLESKVSFYKSKTNELLKVTQNASGLTQVEAKKVLLKQIEENSKEEIASIFRRKYKIAEKSFNHRVNRVLANAVTKYSGEFAAERLTNYVIMENEDIKGRLIGKEGRNIRSLEMTLGVDILLGDENKNKITVSSFNLYRRAIATRTLEILLKDGRINPAKIEETFTKVTADFKSSVIKDAKDTLEKMGVKDMDIYLIELLGRMKYRASYGQNALIHTIEVANLAGLIAEQLGGDIILARRAGLLHDIGKALTHDIKGTHVEIGADLCKQYDEPKEVINAIYAHHGHEEAHSIECAAVCAADSLSAARPGARRGVLEKFLQRSVEIESIALSFMGVNKAYAIDGGRELRVIINAKLVNDDESILLASKIASKIEKKVKYPGEIKVSVIRELRSTGYAK